MFKLPKSLRTFGQVRFVDKLMFTKHLSIMLKSGIPLAESVEALADQTSNKYFMKLLLDMAGRIRSGQSLHKIMENYNEVFDSLYRSIVAIGEESGTLETNLEYLAGELGKAYEFKKKVQGAMLYPTLVLGVAVVVGGGVALFVLPQLVGLFQSLDVALPWSTKLLMWIAILMRDHGPVIAGGAVILFVGLTAFVKSKPVKPKWQKWMLSWPVFGTFFRNVQIASFCRNLGVMLKSGLPINQALKACSEAATNAVYRDYISRLAKAVEKGVSMEKEMSNGKYKYIPKLVMKMIGVGEKTGKLDETLLYLGDFFEEEVDDMAKNLSSVLEPIMLVVIAGMVAWLAFSIISPIYQFTASIKK